MHKITALLIFCSLFLNCTLSDKKTEKKIVKTTLTNQFVITGNFNSFFTSKVYLNKITDTGLYLIDSAKVIDNSFLLKGSILAPERYALCFKNYSSIYVFILENKNIKIDFKVKDILNPTISNSTLNQKLNNYKKEVQQIFNQLDYLYVPFQKARLENDAKKLEEIGKKIKTIEKEFHKFTFSYIQKNKNNVLAAMLLRDQLKTSPIDSLAVLNSYKKLSIRVKNSPDAKIVARYLQLK